jgi:dTDP-L-rhamnose 4-epimerase
MAKKVLIVGGAGFIGSHLADALIEHGHYVRILDNLDPQVHGNDVIRPEYLTSDAELIVGDVRSARDTEASLKQIDVVFHLAAAVGVGQSMYEIARYSSVNAFGTAVLLESIIRHPIERLIVASSMSIYGEGAYQNEEGLPASPASREFVRLGRRQWEPLTADGRSLRAVATKESKHPDPKSVYASLKYNQECVCLCTGAAYNIPTVALRFFNTFGPRQALSNPYTGVMAIFAARMLNGQAPLIYEDGCQQRDFVNVHDLVSACLLAMNVSSLTNEAINVGSGRPVRIKDLARRMSSVLGCEHLAPQITQEYRVGDIRHCYADISKAKKLLGYQPRVTLDQGIAELAAWLDKQTPQRAINAHDELISRGLAL